MTSPLFFCPFLSGHPDTPIYIRAAKRHRAAVEARRSHDPQAISARGACGHGTQARKTISSDVGCRQWKAVGFGQRGARHPKSPPISDSRQSGREGRFTRPERQPTKSAPDRAHEERPKGATALPAKRGREGVAGRGTPQPDQPRGTGGTPAGRRASRRRDRRNGGREHASKKTNRKQGARRGRPKGGAPPRGRGTPAPNAKHGREVEGVSKLPDYQEGNGGTGGTPQATASEPQYKATKRGAAPRSRQSAGIFPARRRRPAATEGSEERPSKEQARSKQVGRGL